MKLSFKVSDILDSVRALSRVAPTGKNEPLFKILECILFEIKDGAVFGTTANQSSLLKLAFDIGIEQQDPELTRFTLPAKSFYDALKSWPSDALVTLQPKGNGQWLLQNGSSRFSLASVDGDTFPEAECGDTSNSIKIEASSLAQCISRVQPAMARTDVRFYLNGMLLKVDSTGLLLVATDGYLMILDQCDIEPPSNSFERIIPREAISELLALCAGGGTITLRNSDSHLVLEKFDDRLVIRCIDHKYPDYERVIPNVTAELEVSRQALLAVMSRATLVCHEPRFRRSEFNLDVDRGIAVTTVDPQTQQQVDDCIDAEGIKTPLEIMLNPDFLEDALRAAPGESVTLGYKDSTTPVIISGSETTSYQAVISPINL